MKAQYAILRFAKYKGPEIGHIESHNERTREQYASNPDVDMSRSHLNFHLVTPSPEFFKGKKKGEIQTYFQEALGFIWEHQDPKTIISAVVHMDEKTPH